MNENIKRMSDYIDFAKETVDSLTSIRENIYSLKKIAWLNRLREIAIVLSGDTQMVFIGEFSSGKSTFVNALLGTNILPTASKPCTSVVTEVQLVSDGLGHRGKIVYLGNNASEELAYDEIIKVIDGSTGVIGKMAAIHHVELKYDISDLANEASPLTYLERAKIKLIDTPGFNSPYGINEDVVMEYLEKSKCSFWFFPSDKIGGVFSKNLIAGIRKKGVDIIPIITKSDRLKNEDEKAEIRERFSEYYSSTLVMKEPRFVSAYKAIEAIEKSKMNPNPAIDEEIEKLNMESGFESVARDLLLRSTSVAISSEKLKIAGEQLNVLFIDLIESSQNEYKFWKKELSSKGWVEDDKYKRIDDIKKQLYKYSKKEASGIAEDFENALSNKVLGMFQSQKSTSAINSEINNIVDTLKGEILRVRFQQAHSYIINKFKISLEPPHTNVDIEIKTPEFSSLDQYVSPVLAIMDSLKYAGPTSIMTGGAGAVVLVFSAYLAYIPVLGVGLATTATVVSGGLFLVAVLPLIPAILDSNRKRSEEAKLKANIQIRNWIRSVKLEYAVEKSLRNMIDEVHERLLNQVDNEITVDLINYESAKGIYDAFVDKQQELTIVFGAKG